MQDCNANVNRKNAPLAQDYMYYLYVCHSIYNDFLFFVVKSELLPYA